MHIPCVCICVTMGICVGVCDCSDSTSITYRIDSLLILNGVTLRVTTIAKQLIKHITFVQMNCMLGCQMFVLEVFPLFVLLKMEKNPLLYFSVNEKTHKQA